MRDTLKKLRQNLVPRYGKGEAEAIIRLIFHHLKGWNTVDLLINEDKTLSPYILEKIDNIMQRLLDDEPIQYIVGEAYFYGMNLKVTPATLIPRPETQQLIDLIVDNNSGRNDLNVLDIGTGSGCIAIALARNLPFSKVTAIDISGDALEVAKENAGQLRVDIKFINADVFKWCPDDSSLDIIVSNPPYIDESEKKDMEPNVLNYEPASALFVKDSDPLQFYRRITEIAGNALRNGGCLYFEINPRHAKELADLITRHGFKNVDIHLDMHGRRRFISAVK